ncbi:MAG TPA: response regulator [Nitrospirota bacterium]|nr:response regulator [Nitrospirota bacterium]
MDSIKKILVVDDEDLIRHSLSSVFHDRDTEITSAATGKDALKAISDNTFNLCFLDMHLPDINGLEIMKMLRDVSPQTRIIMMTGSEITDAIMKEVRENAHCLISKPFELELVKTLVDQVVSTGKRRPREDSLATDSEVSSLQWISDDNRKHQRKPIANSITCYAVAPHGDMTALVVTANILDISETGMGIVTDCKLQPGHIIRLSDAPIHGRGVVRWSVYADTMAAYRAGIQFVSPENVPH